MTTPFQERVYEAVRSIPKGKVATYQYIANQVGCGSPRAIGQALKRNTSTDKTPCHRVIQSSGKVGGYFGQENKEAQDIKKTLLEAEQVIFKEGLVSRVKNAL